MSANSSCGLIALPTDSIDRLGFIAIRYRAWLGEALAQPLASGGSGVTPKPEVLRALCGCFDMIEHLAEDFLVDSGARSATSEKALAMSVQNQAERMKRLLSTFAPAIGDSGLHVPSMGDLDLLCLACQARAGAGAGAGAGAELAPSLSV